MDLVFEPLTSAVLVPCSWTEPTDKTNPASKVQIKCLKVNQKVLREHRAA